METTVKPSAALLMLPRQVVQNVYRDRLVFTFNVLRKEAKQEESHGLVLISPVLRKFNSCSKLSFRFLFFIMKGNTEGLINFNIADWFCFQLHYP